MNKDDISPSVLNLAWKNRSRSCPDRGQCSVCGKVFFASRGAQMPDGVTIDNLLPEVQWPTESTKRLALAMLAEESPLPMQREVGARNRWLMIAGMVKEYPEQVENMATGLRDAYTDAVGLTEFTDPDEFDVELDTTLPRVSPDHVDWELLLRCLIDESP